MGLYGSNGNTPSFVLMKIEECIRLAETAKQSKRVVDKLYEATKYIAELQKMENNGIYKAKPKAKDYTKAFVNKKDKLLMEGMRRAYDAGETKEQILQNKKFFSDEVIAYVEKMK